MYILPGHIKVGGGYTHIQCYRPTQLESFLHSSDTTVLDTHSLTTELLRMPIFTVASQIGGLEDWTSELQCDLQL